MLCSQCGANADGHSSCPQCGADPTLGGRYRLDAILGQGAAGTTYRATTLEGGAQVAVKELLGRQVDALKTAELFDREASVLSELSHPQIPRQIEHFSLGHGKQQAHYLVQELIDGHSLRDEMSKERKTESQICRDVADVLDICSYMHSLRPPVIHRDIKPSNIMRRDADGKLVLIDFGSVRSAVADQEIGGSTIAGTFGYMAPEQFVGKALPQSDIYAVGALAVALLAREDAHAFVDHENRLAWQDKVHSSDALAGVLGDMLERDPELRASDASRVAARLRAIAQGKPDPDGARRVLAAPRPTGVRSNAWTEPPPVPRPRKDLQLSKRSPGMMFNLMFGGLFGGIGALVGGILTIVGLSSGLLLMSLIGGGIGGIFALIGGSFFAFGVRDYRKKTRLWREGKVTKGRVYEVFRDRTIRVNGRSPTAVLYRYTVGGSEHEGKVRVFNARLDGVGPGTIVAVIYDPQEPSQSMAHLR